LTAVLVWHQRARTVRERRRAPVPSSGWAKHPDFSRGEAGSFERREPAPLERARLERRAMSLC